MPEPLQWGKERKQQFVEWVTTDLRRAIGNRSSLERRWIDWLDQYRAAIDTSVKHFPFEGASGKTLPVGAMNVDPLVARFLTTLHAPPNIWTLQANNERWVDVVKPLQDYLQYLDHSMLRMWDVNYRAFLELLKLGTCIYKHGWRFEQRKRKTYGASGKLGPGIKTISAPFVDHVRLVDFVLPPESYAIQADDQGGAPWVAERFYLTQPQFMARAVGQEPFLPNYDAEAVRRVKQYEDNRETGDESARHSRDEYPTSYLRRIELWEIHARYDVAGEGEVDDVVAVLHQDTRELLRATLLPYAHGQRPYEVARYFRGDGFYGIGVCEQSEMFQDAQSELLNLNFDNVLASNSIMLAIRFGANVTAGEPIYPFKIWPLENPKEDIVPIQFGQTRSDLPVLQQYLESGVQRRTGLSDIQFGNPQGLPSRTPATSMMALLQEGNRRFDLSLKDVRLDCMARLGLRVLQNLQQFAADPRANPEGPAYLELAAMVLGEPEGQFVQQALALPLEDIEQGVGVSLTATSGMVNKEVEKQALLALLQLQTQLGQQYIQLAQIATNPQVAMTQPAVAQVASEVAHGLSELQKRVLEQYDIRNPEDILVNTAALQSATRALSQGVPIQPGIPPGANGGAGQPTGGPDPSGGLAALLAGAGAAL